MFINDELLEFVSRWAFLLACFTLLWLALRLRAAWVSRYRPKG